MNNIKCVLFDLDGTLADTSKDMCDCLNIILERRNLKKVDCSELKFHISRGVVGIIEYASYVCLLYTSPSPRDQRGSRMPSSA